MSRRAAIASLLALLAALAWSAPLSAQDGAELTPPPAAAAPVVSAPPPAASVSPAPAPQPVYAAPYAPLYAPAPAYPAPTGRHRPIVAYRNETRAPPALWGTGIGLFLAGYVLNLAITPLANGISDDRDPAIEQDAWAWSLLPVVGPIVQLGLGAPHPAIPITTGLLQLVGAVLFAVGLTETESVRVPVRAGDPEDPNVPTLGFDVDPLPGGGQVRVSLQHF
ncbi:MAG: hypothetical protein KF729_17615 [Sandaracinaceae bacterium]|nr:hypothetical protein [Sandaracinaceae bacterium]